MASLVRCTTIVDPSACMTDEQILEENHTLSSLGMSFRTKLETVQWLAKRGLIRNSSKCPNCSKAMTFVLKSKVSEGYFWRCKHCEKHLSARQGSLFSKSRLSLFQLTIILHCWTQNRAREHICREAGLSDCPVTHSTILEWSTSFRRICKDHFLRDPIKIGGLNEDGTSKEVEIDETEFDQRYGIERSKGICIFGGIERDSKKFFLVELADRTDDNLASIIEKHILPGSIVISSQRRGYNVEQVAGGVYEHCEHKHIFADPEHPDIHTQHMKNTFLAAKRKLRGQIPNSMEFPYFLQEFVWRKNFGDNFEQFLIFIRRQYHF